MSNRFYDNPGAVPMKTEEEVQLQKKCEDEAFYKRSLPLAAINGSLTILFLKKKWILPTEHFGKFTMFTFATGMGYFLGKASYRTTFQERFLTELPNSNTTWMIRAEQRQWGNYMSNEDMLLLVDCKKKMFWSHTVPICSLFGVIPTVGHLSGVLPPHALIGACGYPFLSAGYGLILARLLFLVKLSGSFLLEQPESYVSQKYRRALGVTDYKNEEYDAGLVLRLEKLHDTLMFRSLPLSLALSVVSFSLFPAVRYSFLMFLLGILAGILSDRVSRDTLKLLL